MYLRLFALCCAAVFTVAGHAQISIENAWVRATVPGQKATGAFMTIASEKPVQLVRAASSAVKKVEVHEMTIVDGVMKMREVSAIDVTPGKVTELKPGSFHIMLMNLESPIASGSTVPLTLTFRDAAGKEEMVKIDAAAREVTATQKR
jgi:copper(I)-binding protein